RGGAGAAAHSARRDRSPRPARRLDRRWLPADADAIDACRGRDALAVEFPAVLSSDHLDRLGVFLLSDGGLLHLRRGHDAACRRPYPCRATAEKCTGAAPAWARDPLGVRRLRLPGVPDLGDGQVRLGFLHALAALDVKRHAAVVSANRRYLRDAAADAAIPGARHPGVARAAARRSSHEGFARRMTA